MRGDGESSTARRDILAATLVAVALWATWPGFGIEVKTAFSTGKRLQRTRCDVRIPQAS